MSAEVSSCFGGFGGSRSALRAYNHSPAIAHKMHRPPAVPPATKATLVLLEKNDALDVLFDVSDAVAVGVAVGVVLAP